MLKPSLRKNGTDLDMTPMVDVTFLLLIFFMVTASFVLQRSMDHPPADGAAAAPAVEVSHEIIASVDANDHFLVDGTECLSAREMRFALRDAVLAKQPEELVVRAHEDSTHAKVVQLMDAGVGSGIERIRLETTQEDF